MALYDHLVTHSCFWDQGGDPDTPDPGRSYDTIRVSTCSHHQHNPFDSFGKNHLKNLFIEWEKPWKTYEKPWKTYEKPMRNLFIGYQMPKPMREHLADAKEAHAADLLAGDVFMASSGAGAKIGKIIERLGTVSI